MMQTGEGGGGEPTHPQKKPSQVPHSGLAWCTTSAQRGRLRSAAIKVKRNKGDQSER